MDIVSQGHRPSYLDSPYVAVSSCLVQDFSTQCDAKNKYLLTCTHGDPNTPTLGFEEMYDL